MLGAYQDFLPIIVSFANGCRCGQIFVSSLGSSKPENTVSIPGYLEPTDKGLTTDVDTIKKQGQYTVPGPKVYKSSKDVQAPQGVSKEYENSDSKCAWEGPYWCAAPLGSYKNREECSSVSLAISLLIYVYTCILISVI